MEWIIIIVIGLVIFFLIGGINPIPLVDYQVPEVQLTANQWHCEEVVWNTPKVENDKFSGTMEVSCEFEGLSGGGMVELRKHMLDALPASAEKIHAGPVVVSYSGLPAVGYDLTLKMKAEDEEVLVRGKTYIATNGFTEIRNAFHSTKIPTSGSAKYLKELKSEIQVAKTSKENWYRFRIKSNSQILKPWFVPSETFSAEVQKRSRDDFKENAQKILTDIANHI